MSWSLRSLFSETLLYDSNPGLTPISPGYEIGALTNVSADLTAKAPTWEFGLDSSRSYPVYAGPGAQPQGKAPSAITAHFQKTTKLTAYNFSMTMSNQQTSQTELIDSGLITTNATRSTKSYSAGITHQVNYLNSLGIAFSKTSVTFSGDTSGLLHPFNDLSISGSWLHHVNHRTDLTSQIGYEQFDSSLESDKIYTASEAINWKINKNLSFSGTEGLSLTQNHLASTLSPFSSLQLNYNRKTSSFSVFRSEGSAPSSLGTLQSFTTLGFSASKTINDHSGLIFSVANSSYSSSQGARKLLTISPGYTFQINRYVQGQLIYRYIQTKSAKGDASSNEVTLTFSRPFDIFR